MSVHAWSPDMRRYPSADTTSTATRIDSAAMARRDQRIGFAAGTASGTGKPGAANAPFSSARITDDVCRGVSAPSASGTVATTPRATDAALRPNADEAPEDEPLAASASRVAMAGDDDEDARSI